MRLVLSRLHSVFSRPNEVEETEAEMTAIPWPAGLPEPPAGESTDRSVDLEAGAARAVAATLPSDTAWPPDRLTPPYRLAESARKRLRMRSNGCGPPAVDLRSLDGTEGRPADRVQPRLKARMRVWVTVLPWVSTEVARSETWPFLAFRPVNWATAFTPSLGVSFSGWDQVTPSS